MKQLTFASLQVTDLEAATAFYTQKLGFEIATANPQACVFTYNHGQASFAIRTPLEPLDGKALGLGVALWFAVDSPVSELRETYLSRGIDSIGPVIQTPFGAAFHLKDPDGYKLTFLEEA